jgi:hypothetical protein
MLERYQVVGPTWSHTFDVESGQVVFSTNGAKWAVGLSWASVKLHYTKIGYKIRKVET